MTLADRLRAEDPDRYAMAMLAPAAARDRLLTLYALNAELARTALSAREPMVAEMRVQWWVDRLTALKDGAPPPHELLSPLWDAWGPEAASFSTLAEARRHDALREPFRSAAAVEAYAAATGGALMAAAAGTLGAAGEVVRLQGLGAALVAWLRARAALQDLGLGLARPEAATVASLGRTARQALEEAARLRRELPRAAAPTLFAGAGLRAALAQAESGRDPAAPSDFARRAALARLGLTGRWWI